MNKDNARILVIGAGTNGSICASRLFDNGANITVLLRGKRYEQVKNQGIIIENPLNKKRTVSKVPAINNLEENDVYDYILVVVRKSQLSELLPVLAKNKSPNIVFMTNNFSGPDEIIKVIDKKRIMMGFVFGSGNLDDGVVYAISEVGGIIKMIFKKHTPFGEIDGSITPRLKRLVSIFVQNGLPAKINTNIVDHLSTHAAIIVFFSIYLMNNYENVTEKEILEIMTTSEYMGLSIKAMREFISFFQKIGRKILPSSMGLIKIIPLSIIKMGFKTILKSKYGPTIISDYSRGKDEIRYLANEVVDFVERFQYHMPSVREILKMK